ncbi:hypothetical protein [Reyranella sp.]|uniref:hypothetical protein n=1 Tax=Reyranella sp. TaxID=1929291 RepID=UPI0037835991
MKSAVLVAMAVALTACGMQPVPVVPLANRQSDAAGKRFWNPMPGMAAVYIYRGPDAIPPQVLSLTARDRQVGWLTPSTWIRDDVAPGRYDVGCVVGRELAGSTSLDLRPSTMIFLQASTQAGSNACTLSEVPANIGRDGVVAAVETQPPYGQ